MRKKYAIGGAVDDGSVAGAQDQLGGIAGKLEGIGATAKSALGDNSMLSTPTAQAGPSSNNINSKPAPTALAKGGKVRGCGVASKGLTKGRMR